MESESVVNTGATTEQIFDAWTRMRADKYTAIGAKRMLACAPYLVPNDSRVIGPDVLNAIDRVLEWVSEAEEATRANISDDLELLEAVIGERRGA